MSTNFSTNTPPSSIYDLLYQCFYMPSGRYHSISFTLINVPFVLPLCLYILFVGVQRWRRREKSSHTDFFTYNLVLIQLLSILGSVFVTLNLLFRSSLIVMMGIYMFFINASANVCFQILTCLERYMAAVHPVTYLRLRSKTWINIRNITCAYVWLQCVIQTISLASIKDITGYFIISLTGLFLSLALVLFCNLSVLCALIRPGPGDGARVNRSKQKALNTITAITGTLFLKFGGDVLSTIMCLVTRFDDNIKCGVWFSVIWFTLPGTLVLPLLFLHRAEELRCFKRRSQQEPDL